MCPALVGVEFTGHLPACVPRLQRLPISLPELVESAPSLTADGSIILGRRDSKVFLLDKRTGRGVHTLSNAAEALEDHSSSFGERGQQLGASSVVAQDIGLLFAQQILRPPGPDGCHSRVCRQWLASGVTNCTSGTDC
jgi:serine/threonine-protein kinase/endoribonuclease IRE1